jgi:hypothetical protein
VISRITTTATAMPVSASDRVAQEPRHCHLGFGDSQYFAMTDFTGRRGRSIKSRERAAQNPFLRKPQTRRLARREPVDARETKVD